MAKAKPRRVRCTRCRHVFEAPEELSSQGGEVSCDHCEATLHLPPRKSPLGESTCEARAVRKSDSGEWSARANLVGRKLGPCRVEEAVGSGGICTVYKGQHTRLDCPVAIKVLTPEFAEDPETVQRFVREARTAAKVTHPTLVSIHDVGGRDGLYYIVMEFVEGRTLDQVIHEEGPMGERQLARFGKDVARGLAAAHKAGVVHRDIKPGNLMLTDEGEVKITDFGLARAEHSQEITRVGQIMGTPLYMSPEQCHGHPLTALSDIYSFGLTLYYLATGVQPMQADTTAATLVNQVSNVPPPPREIDPGIGRELSELIMKMVEKDSADRPQSVVEVAERLEEIAYAQPDAEPDTEPEARPARPRRARPSGEDSGARRASSRVRGESSGSRRVPAPRATGKSSGRRALERRPSSGRRPVEGRSRGPSPLLIGVPILLIVIGSAGLMAYLNRGEPPQDGAPPAIDLSGQKSDHSSKKAAPRKVEAAEWQKHLDAYRAAERTGARERAIKQLDQYLRYRPTDWKMREKLIELAAENDEPELAIKHLRNFISNDRKADWARGELIGLYLAAGRAAEALPLLEKRLASDPTPKLRLQLARARVQLGHPLRAAAQLLALPPAERAEAADLIAKLRQPMLQKFGKAYQQFKPPGDPVVPRLTDLDPDYWFYRLMLAVHLLMRRQPKQAIVQFDRMLSLPGKEKARFQHLAHIGKANCYLASGQPRRSMPESRTLIELFPVEQAPQYLAMRLRAQMMLRQWKRARVTLTLLSWYARNKQWLGQWREQLTKLSGSDALATAEQVARAYRLGFQVRTMKEPMMELAIGDWITVLDGKPLRRWARLNKAIRQLAAGKRGPLKMTVLRDGTPREVTLPRKRFSFSGMMHVKILQTD